MRLFSISVSLGELCTSTNLIERRVPILFPCNLIKCLFHVKLKIYRNVYELFLKKGDKAQQSSDPLEQFAEKGQPHDTGLQIINS